MMPPTTSDQPHMVSHLRGIREQLSREIQGMTFEQQRAYLNQLLAQAALANNQPPLAEGAAA